MHLKVGESKNVKGYTMNSQRRIRDTESIEFGNTTNIFTRNKFLSMSDIEGTN
jgi:hypothetical protein